MSNVTSLAMAYRSVPATRLALLGTGVVGAAFVARYQRLQQGNSPLPEFAWLANSRVLNECDGAPGQALENARASLRSTSDLPPWAETEALRRIRGLVEGPSRSIGAHAPLRAS